ncbi:MAG: hypothetical protein WD552_02995 [Candidatus Paceibacterota bacterium]
MKILIIESNVAYRDYLVEELSLIDHDVQGADQEDGLITFLDFSPDVTLVLEYYEQEKRVRFQGRQTYQDVKNSATDGQQVFRAGVFDLTSEYEDYLSAMYPDKLVESLVQRIEEK